MRILVGVDGSGHAKRALEWCATFARAFDAEVVAVHVVDIGVFVTPHTAHVPVPALTTEQRDVLREVMANEWCAPLADASVPFHVRLMEGSPPLALMQAAKNERADLVVVGRRGRGGFAELVLGSTSHALSHHLDRPLVIVP